MTRARRHWLTDEERVLMWNFMTGKVTQNEQKRAVFAEGWDDKRLFEEFRKTLPDDSRVSLFNVKAARTRRFGLLYTIAKPPEAELPLSPPAPEVSPLLRAEIDAMHALLDKLCKNGEAQTAAHSEAAATLKVVERLADAMQKRMQALEDRVGRLERAPVADLGDLKQKVDLLDGHITNINLALRHNRAFSS